MLRTRTSCTKSKWVKLTWCWFSRNRNMLRFVLQSIVCIRCVSTEYITRWIIKHNRMSPTQTRFIKFFCVWLITVRCWGCHGNESRWEARLFARVQTGPGTHPPSYTMGTGSLPGVKWPGRGVDYPPHLARKLKKEYGYTSTPPLGLRGMFKSEL
jgi:hypothetical protein